MQPVVVKEKNEDISANDKYGTSRFLVPGHKDYPLANNAMLARQPLDPYILPSVLSSNILFPTCP